MTWEAHLLLYSTVLKQGVWGFSRYLIFFSELLTQRLKKGRTSAQSVSYIVSQSNQKSAELFLLYFILIHNT